MGFNALRIPLSAHHVFSNGLPSDWAINPSWNPELRGKPYLELVDALPELPAPVTPVDARRRCPRHILRGQ